MTELQDKLVLVSQAALFDIAGSEVVCFEVARYFAVHAASVIVVTYGYSPQWEAQFSSLPNVSLYRFDDAALDVRLGERSPDLAWIHHQLIPEPLLRNASATTFVFHHMSAFQLQEFPLSPSIERSLASSIVFPAVETRGSQLSSGLLEGVPSRRLLVFGNPAPDEFYAEPVDWAARPERPRTVLIVSNHPPAELQAAVALLDPTIRVSTLGGDSAAGATKRLVVPSDIKDVDVVVSIGKTVQYAVVGGVPVYCYDHFGGPGWLTPENFDAARRANFSGRGFPKKPAAAIAEEIMEGFAHRCDCRGDHGGVCSGRSRCQGAPRSARV